MLRTMLMLGVVGFSVLAPAATVSAQGKNTPNWVHDAVLYQVFVRAFSNEGTLNAVTARIPEMADLGVNTIYLMPIHPIGHVGRTGTAGSPYSIIDYETIDPQLGDTESLHNLVTTAHAHDLRVIMDLVINHTSLDHPFVEEKPEWYRWHDDGTLVHPDPQWTDVAQLNYDNEELRAYMIDMAADWIRTFDIDGFRADVSYKIPIDFWLQFRDAMRALKPDIMLLSESDTRPLFLAFDHVYNWTIGEQVQHVAAGRKKPMALLQYTDWSRAMNYLENHDQPRIASFLPRVATKPYATFLLTMSGIPLIQNGQEIGASKRLSLFDPDGIDWRRPDENLKATYKKLIELRREHPELRRGALQLLTRDEESDVLAYVKRYHEHASLVIINFSGLVQSTEIPLPIVDGNNRPVDRITGEPVTFQSVHGDVVVTVQPWQSMIVPLN